MFWEFPGPEAGAVGEDVDFGDDVEGGFGAAESCKGNAEFASAGDNHVGGVATEREFAFEELHSIITFTGSFRCIWIVLCWACVAGAGALDEGEGFLETRGRGLVARVDFEANLVMPGEEELLQKSLIIKVFFESGLCGERRRLDRIDGIHDGCDDLAEVIGGCGRLVCGGCVCHSEQGNTLTKLCQIKNSVW